MPDYQRILNIIESARGGEFFVHNLFKEDKKAYYKLQKELAELVKQIRAEERAFS